MIVAAAVLLLAAVLLRHPALSSALGLLALLLILGVLVGHPGWTILAGVAGLAVRVLWEFRRHRGDRDRRDRRRGWRFEPYVCSDCGQPWEQREVWDAHVGVWRFAAPPYGFCPACHPELVS